VGVCGLPAAVFFVVVGVGGDAVVSRPLVMGVSALIAYPVAVWLWLRSRRSESAGRAWLFATLGLLLVAGTSCVPMVTLGSALVDEWRETQPGGRGYPQP